MKLRRLFFTFLLLLAAFQVCFSQEKPKAVLFSEFGKVCSGEFTAHLNAYIKEIANNPTMTGYLIFYGEKSLPEGKNQNYYRATQYLLRFRRFDISRIVFSRGENRETMLTQFWIVPAGASPPIPDKSFVEHKVVSTTLFDNGFADFNRFYEHLDIYINAFVDYDNLDIYGNAFLVSGCDFSPNRNAFAKVLLANKNLDGHLIIYTKFGKGKNRAKRIANFALKELVENFKIPPTRLKTIYGGNRGEPEIEFWLVPKDEKPPVPKPDAK